MHGNFRWFLAGMVLAGAFVGSAVAQDWSYQDSAELAKARAAFQVEQAKQAGAGVITAANIGYLSILHGFSKDFNKQISGLSVPADSTQDLLDHGVDASYAYTVGICMNLD